jgi:hypothetical protein
MKRPIAYILIGAAVLGASASLALAQEGHGHGMRMMHRVDLNGDGAITPTEVSAVHAVRFLKLDKDADGVITEAEMLARMQKWIAGRVAKRFAMMDRNGDGRVERAEFEEGGTERFARQDTDGDGRVSREELRAHQHGRGRGGHHGKLPVE